MKEFVNYKYLKTLDEVDLDAIGISEDEREHIFGMYDYDKLIALIQEHGSVSEHHKDLNDRNRLDAIEHGKYVIAVFETVMGFEEWHLYELNLRVGDCVIWHDPDEETRDLSRVWAIDKINGEVITISDDYSEAEVYESELELF